jgi:hypothetical protein
MIAYVRSAIKHLAGFESVKEYPLYEYDREQIRQIATTEEWTDADKRAALFLFAKYRRVLVRDGFDYYKVFPKNSHNADLEARTKKVWDYVDYLVKHHNQKPPRGYDLLPLEDLELWVREKIVELRGKNAERNGTTVATV